MDWKFYPEQNYTDLTWNEHKKLSIKLLQIHNLFKTIC